MPSAGEEQSQGGFYSCGYYSDVTHDNVVLNEATPQLFHGLDTAHGYTVRQYANYPAGQRSSPRGLGPDSVEYWIPAEPGNVGVALLSWTKFGNAFTLMVTATGLDRAKYEAAARQIYTAIT